MNESEQKYLIIKCHTRLWTMPTTLRESNTHTPPQKNLTVPYQYNDWLQCLGWSFSLSKIVYLL